VIVSQGKRRKGSTIQDLHQDPFQGLEMVNQGTKDLNFCNGPHTENFLLSHLLPCKYHYIK